ncbi:MAG: RIP metalloprotease RseP [Pseudomonadota bacterium]
MDLITNLFATDGFVLGVLVPFFFVLMIVIFIHELGHYLVGRWCGIGAKAFSIGFGPEIFGFTDRHGTRWRFSAIPLGGYVRFIGDMNVASTKADMDEGLFEAERARSFHNKPVWKRAATVFAGPAANFILAIVIFTMIFSVWGRTVADPVVSTVQENSAAAEAGIEPGDVFVALDGTPVETFAQVQRYVGPRADVPIAMQLRRNDALVEISITPQRLEIEDQFGNRMEQGVIGVVADREDASFRTRDYSLTEAFFESFRETGYVIARTGGYLAGVITGRERADQIGGPIRVAQVSGQVATLGWLALVNLVAILSISIGLLNLLPVPVLDGGHLMFYAAEALRGRPLSENAQEIGHRIGFAMILGLMVFATWNDITMLMSRGS